MAPKDHKSRESELLQQLRQRLESESGDALELLESPENNPICSITVDHSLPGIVIKWKRYATSTQLRFIHEHLLNLIMEHGLSKVLGDDTAFATIDTDDHAWIVQDWMPRAISAGFKAAASKSPSSYFGKLATEGIQKEAPPGLNLRAFDNITDARRWLQAV